ncbi:MAG: enoyl-CoA hydratase/isomerase family protein [Gammaproteobacteria bacterium]|nr:enoyl-CoA hydratase/isomerase family protein [Gammaproteobacteria bacterium]
MLLEVYREKFPSLGFSDLGDGILQIVLHKAERLNAADANMHRDLAYVWTDIDRDDDIRVVLVRGEGKAFSAGGDFELIEEMMTDDDALARVWKEARDLVYNIVNCEKPVVSAIHGPAVGAGLAVALLADVSVAGRNAKIIDGHTTLGVAAGDHSVLIWPLLCGLAKSKYYLMTNTPLSGAEAERIGLVSMCVGDGEVHAQAEAVARKLAHASQRAIRWTKYALNNWLRSFGPHFDASLALEFMGFRQPDIKEGLSALKEKRKPRFK